MEPKYKVHADLTEEEFVRFSLFVSHSNKTRVAIIIVCGLIILALAVGDLIKGTHVARAIGFLAGELVCLWLFTFGVARQAKKYYRQYVVKESTEQDILFFDDHFEQVTGNATSSVEYSHLNHIYFTKTNIYLMRAPNIGVVLPLASCPDGLAEFLHNVVSQSQR